MKPPKTDSRQKQSLEIEREHRVIDDLRILSARIVAHQFGVSRTTLWRMWRTGQFPKPVQISAGRVGFLAEDVERWLDGKRGK